MSLRIVLALRRLVALCAVLYSFVQAGEALADPPRMMFLVDTSATYVRADSGTQNPAAAFNGMTYLITWADKCEGQWDINAVRVSPAGHVVDTTDIAVCRAEGPQQNPTAASDGSGFLVAWEDQRSGLRWNVYAARLDSTGCVLDSEGILLRSLNGDKHSPSVAFGAGSYLVAWDEYYGSRNIVAALVDTAGQVGDGIEVCALPGTQCSPSVAFGDSLFLVAWNDTRNGDRTTIYAARITESGVLLDTNGFAVMTPHDAQVLPSVAYDGANFIVSWQEGPVLNSDILAARIAPTGVVLDTAALCISDAPRDQSRPRAVFAESCYFVVWEDSRSGTPDVYCARVTSAGQVIDTAGIHVSEDIGPKLAPAIATGDSQLLVAWQSLSDDTTPHGISGSRISTSGGVLDTLSFLIGADVRKKYTQQENPSVTYGDSSWLVVWADYRPDTLHTGIYALRLASDGTPLDGSAIRISSGDGDDLSPRAAFDGSNYLIVWTDSNSARCDIHGRRLSHSGMLLDTIDVPIASSSNREGSPAVVHDGSNFLVVWEESTARLFHVCGRRVSSQGVVLDSLPITVGTRPSSRSPALACGDSWSLVVWCDSSRTSNDIVAVRITRQGRVLDSVPAKINAGSRRCRQPAVARCGDQFVAVWVVHQPSNVDSLLGAVLRWPGQNPETTQVKVHHGHPKSSLPSIAYNGRDCIVAWWSWDVKIAVRGARINQSGAVMDRFQVLVGSRDYYLGGLAAGLDSSMLVVFTTITDSINGLPANCLRVWGLLSPLSGIAEYGEQTPISSLECSPNPFSRSAYIIIRTQDALCGPLRIYDASGRVIRTLKGGSSRRASTTAIVWDGRDDSGMPARPGCYFIRLDCGRTRTQAKLVRTF